MYNPYGPDSEMARRVEESYTALKTGAKNTAAFVFAIPAGVLHWLEFLIAEENADRYDRMLARQENAAPSDYYDHLSLPDAISTWYGNFKAGFDR